MASALGIKIATGAAWMVALRWSHRLVGLVSMAFLARLLAPGDFGLVALAMSAIALVELFGQTHVDIALIRRDERARDLYDSAWTLELIRGAVVALVVAAIAVPAATFFAEPRLSAVLWVLAAVQLLAAFQNIGTIEFRKELHFRRDFAFELSSRIAGAALTIAAAVLIGNYWALVAGVILQSASKVGLSYGLSAYRPRPCFARIGEIFRFSKWVVVQNVSHGLRDQAPVFIVSRLINVEVLGFFNAAREISSLVTSELRAPIRRALFPGFARASVESGALKAGVVEAFGILLLLSLPVAVGLYAVAPLAVPLLLGERWAPTVPLLQVLAIHGIVQSFGVNSPMVLNRLDRPRISGLAGVGLFVLVVPLLFVAALRFGIDGIVWVIVGSGVLNLATDHAMIRRVLGVRAKEIAVRVWRPCLGALVMAVVLDVLRSQLPVPGHGWAVLPLLLTLVLCGAIVYPVTVWVAWRAAGAPQGAEHFVVEALRATRKQRRQSAAA